jgi:glutamate formiminotransferase / 5-formyltetrahydrofolate cyclo-ligase
VTLLAFPNVSEARDAATVEALHGAWAPARVLDLHADPDHNRTAITLAGQPGGLAGALVHGAREVLARVNITRHEGAHPFVGALDVAPVVWVDAAHRGAACAEALVAADELGRRLDLPVFLYGELAGGRSRAVLRRGGPTELQRRIEDGELRPDFGPPRLHPTGGATLVGARPPLVAFNLWLAPGAHVERARVAAAAIRESGEQGLPGVRALGLELGHRVQVSTNVERPDLVTLAEVTEAVRSHVEVVEAELVGLAPREALENFPPEVPLDTKGHILEEALSETQEAQRETGPSI